MQYLFKRPLLALIVLTACSVPADRTASFNDDPSSLYAFHGQAGNWFNPWRVRNARGTDLLRWAVSRSAFTGEWRDPPEVARVPNDGTSLSEPGLPASATWVGHSTFVIHDGEDVFLTDPHFGNRALIPSRLHPPGVPINSIPSNAFTVVSHNHYDHLDAYTVETLPDTIQWFVPLGLGDWIKDKGKRAIELDWWQTARHGDWQVTCVPVQHWSRRIEQPTNSTLWCGWVITNARRTYFFAGDTGYFHGFKEIALKFGKIDVAILPIGAYEPRWIMRYSHVNPGEAYQAFLDLGARWMLPCHWGTFRLTDEPIDEPPRELLRVVAKAGGDPERIKVLAIGERWAIGDDS